MKTYLATTNVGKQRELKAIFAHSTLQIVTPRKIPSLDVIEDANGKTLTYVWADDTAHAIGLNLGWLQVGLHEEPADAHK